MQITLEDGDAGSVIRLEGEIDISCSHELKRLLIEAVSSRKELQLDAARITDLDVTAVQLLWAAAREMEKSGTSFVVAGEIPEHVNCAIREAGLASFPVPVMCLPGNDTLVSVTAEGVDD